MGNPNAPSSPWGRDELDVLGDGRVLYRNLRGPGVRSVTAQLAPGAAEKLFAAIAASPFPVWTDTRPLPPGSTLVELTVERPEGAATARFDYHTSLKTPGTTRWSACSPAGPGCCARRPASARPPMS
jgi:hypothetical protein